MHLNLHQLELFYYAGLHGGFPQAAAKMPYGIDASTISRQLCDLERQTGLDLYQRRPFRLTQVGEELFAVLKPVMGDLPGLVRLWRKGLPGAVRLGGSPVVLRNYLPPSLALLQKGFPGLQLICNEGSQAQIESWLRDGLIDLAVTLMERSLPSEYESEVLARLPLVLLIPATSKVRSTTELWRQRRIEAPLVCVPPDHPLTQAFADGLKRHKVEWPVTTEVNSVELVEAYVREGLGMGVSLAMPGRASIRSKLRALPLTDFPPAQVRLIWRRNQSEALKALIKELRQATRQLLKRT